MFIFTLIMTDIPILTERPSRRLNYVLDFINSQYKGLRLYNVQIPIISIPGEPLLIYSSLPPTEGVFIASCGYLEDGAAMPKSKLVKSFPLPYIFPTDQKDLFGFDIFAAIFWMLSRTEEYASVKKDEHGRFQALHSAAQMAGILKLPIVDHWVGELVKSINKLFGTEFQRNPQTKPFVLTVDVDQAYKFIYKPIWKNVAALCVDFITFEWGEMAKRFSILTQKKLDPFDSYDRLFEINLSKDSLLFFFLCGGKSTFDTHLDIRISPVKKLIQKIRSKALIGIHPSYTASTNQTELSAEKKLLENVSGENIVRSRQHYLRLNLPETYRMLIDEGITEDYTMGFADETGFRAGTCHSFLWYDLKKDQVTNLRIHPLIAMDRTYLSYMKVRPHEAVADMVQLYQNCVQFGGTFQLLWHNSSFDFEGEWDGWENVFEEIIKIKNS
jgi:hypothetical protein